MVLRNVLDKKVFFLHVAIVITDFQSEKLQNKLDSMQSVLLKRFTKLVKMNLKREQSKSSHASVILNSHFAWIFTKALFYILSTLSASKRLRKALNCHEKMQSWRNYQFRFKTGSWCIPEYYSYHFKMFDWLVLKLQETETETLKLLYIHVYKVFG